MSFHGKSVIYSCSYNSGIGWGLWIWVYVFCRWGGICICKI